MIVGNCPGSVRGAEAALSLAIRVARLAVMVWRSTPVAWDAVAQEGQHRDADIGQNGFAEAQWVKAALTRRAVFPGSAGSVSPAGTSNRGRTVMSPQRQRMIEGMILVGLSEGTQAAYLRAVWQLAKSSGQVLSAHAGPTQRGRGPHLSA